MFSEFFLPAGAKYSEVMNMNKKEKSARIVGTVHGTYATQPISSPDSRFPRTGAARPDDGSVEANKHWVDENEK